MSTDWKTLNEKTNTFRTLTVTKDDPAHLIVDALFCGLEVKLSEIVGDFPFGGASTLTIFADTLVVDVPSFDARGTVMMARSIDVSLLQGSPVLMRVPPQGETAIAEFLVKESVGGTFKLATSEATAGSPAFTVPIGERPLQAVYYTVQSDGTTTHQVMTNAADLQDLISRVWALNSLKASFTAASWLMDSDQVDDRQTARSMLSWVLTCISTLGASIPSDYAELYSQAAALLVTLNVASGAYYVPVLSSNFYQQQVDTLLGALQSYEDNLNTLHVETNLQQAIQQVSGTLQGVAQDEIGPLQGQLDNLTANITSLSNDIHTLSQQFDIQCIAADNCYSSLKTAIAKENIVQFLRAGVQLSTDTVMVGIDAFAAEADPTAVAWGYQAFVDEVTTAVNAIETISSDFPGDTGLLDQAKTLLQMQEQLMTSLQAATVLWAQAQQLESSAQLPQALAVVSIAPSLAWDNYMLQVEAALTSIKEQIGTADGSSDAQDAANQYLASLKILAQYGKAIDAKYIAYASQLAQATAVKAQIRSAQNTQARWKTLEQQAQSEEEQLAALKGLIQSRMDAIKRAVYVSWTHYRAAYFYLFFQEPVHLPHLYRKGWGGNASPPFLNQGEFIESKEVIDHQEGWVVGGKTSPILATEA